MIILPRRLADLHPIVMPKVGIDGEYIFIRRGPDGRERSRLGPMHNLVLDSGLDAMGQASANGKAIVGRCQVGTGTAAPTAGDTGLGSVVATTETNVGPASATTYDAGNRRMATTSTFRFAAGAAAGNLTEVGMSSNSSPYPYWSRALIVDGGGNPTTLTILSDEILDVVYTAYMNIPLDASGSFSMTMDGTPTNFAYTIRPCRVGVTNVWGLMFNQSGAHIRPYTDGYENSTGGLAVDDITAAITGYNTNQGMGWSNVGGDPPYTNGNYYKDLTWTRPIGVTPTKTVKSLWVHCGWFCFQMNFTPTWDISSDKQFVFTLRPSWGRA